MTDIEVISTGPVTHAYDNVLVTPELIAASDAADLDMVIVGIGRDGTQTINMTDADRGKWLGLATSSGYAAFATGWVDGGAWIEHDRLMLHYSDERETRHGDLYAEYTRFWWG